MKKFLISLLCVLLVISISSNVYSVVKFNSYREKNIDSLMTEISRQTSYLKEDIQDMIEEENASWDHMREIYKGFSVLSSLFKANRDICHESKRGIFHDAESDFLYMGCTFLGSGYTTPCYTDGIYEDEMIADNEIEYMKRIIEILDKTLLNVYVENEDAFDMDILNGNLKSVSELLHSYEDSPYLLIKNHTT